MIKTLAARLTLWYGLAFTLAVGVLFAVFYWVFDSTLQAAIDDDLIEDIEEFQQILADEGMTGIELEILRESKEVGEAEKAFIQIISRDGRVIYATDMEHWAGLKTDDSLLTQIFEREAPYLYNLELDSREDEVRALYSQLSDNLVLHIGESVEKKDDLMELLLMIISGMFLIALPIALYLGWLMSRKATKGINAVSKIAREIEYRALDKRVSGEMWGSEIQTLADTFNAMLDRIRDLVLEMRELTDNVAHDLRSPLARIRVISEASLSQHDTPEEFRSAAADIIEECDRLMQMINATLDLAELEAGAASLHKTKFNLTELVIDAVELFHPLAEEKQIQLTLNKKPECYVVGDMQSLQRMLANLLDNAIKYTPKEGHIDVDIIPNHNFVKVVVADTGIGIPPEERQKVFERFYRCDENRLEKGCGLGLSFARAVAKAHGGEIDLNSEYGKGSAFSVSLSNFSGVVLH